MSQHTPNARPAPKGWCPSAYNPMSSGDGLLVRLKPRYGRYRALQLSAISKLALQYGNGVIDLTSRANLQIRGVKSDDYPSLLAALQTQNLVQADAATEQLNLLMSPNIVPSSDGWNCAEILYEMASSLAHLPAKFGFAIDTGPHRFLTNASADIRLEQSQDGVFLLRCDGHDTGFKTNTLRFADDILALVSWFSDHQTDDKRRMLSLKDQLPLQWQGDVRANPDRPLAFDALAPRQMIAAPYGQIDATELAALGAALAQDTDIMLLPNRSLLNLEGAFTASQLEAMPNGITDAGDIRLTIAACAGMPACGSATIDTRRLADDIAAAGLVSPEETLHISGCAKGCASSRTSDICITGVDAHYDVIEKGCAWQCPSVTSLSRPELLAWLATHKEERPL